MDYFSLCCSSRRSARRSRSRSTWCQHLPASAILAAALHRRPGSPGRSSGHSSCCARVRTSAVPQRTRRAPRCRLGDQPLPLAPALSGRPALRPTGCSSTSRSPVTARGALMVGDRVKVEVCCLCGPGVCRRRGALSYLFSTLLSCPHTTPGPGSTSIHGRPNMSAPAVKNETGARSACTDWWGERVPPRRTAGARR